MRRLGAAGLLCFTACVSAAPSPVLLFFRRAVTARVQGLTWAPDPDSSRLLGFDDNLHVARTLAGPELETPVAVAALGRSILVSERLGAGVVFDTGGRALRDWDAPDPADIYAAASGRVVAARSPYYVTFRAEEDTAPLLRLLDTLGNPLGRIATVHLPAVPFFVELANAGAVAADRSGVYFAPLVRDEIDKYDWTGARRFQTSRGLFAHEEDPALTSTRPPSARYAVVNVALTLARGRLYALGSTDSSGSRLRVDVVDTSTGAILATRPVPGDAAVVLSGDEVLVFDADSLERSAASLARAAFGPPFALPDLKGDTVRLADFRGRVTLVNFWASWCDPCRAEFPNMAELTRDFPSRDFAVAAISDDRAVGEMLAFVKAFHPPFLVLVGGGRMRELYHYRGLPYSVLLDRRGQVVKRLFGFGGSDEFAALKSAIAKELRGP